MLVYPAQQSMSARGGIGAVAVPDWHPVILSCNIATGQRLGWCFFVGIPVMMKSATDLLFVYGTLRRGLPMHRLLRPHAVFLGEGRVQGRLYEAGGYPGLVLEGDGRVKGELYRLRRPNSVLRVLDRYEGCSPSDPQPHEYRRVLTEVRRARGGRMRAWVYEYRLPAAGLELIPSGDYRFCLRSFRA